MSTHYHAFQARGFAFSIYEPQVEQWHSFFTGFDPRKVAKTLGLNFDEDYLYLDYGWRSYRLRLADGVLEKHPGLLPAQAKLLAESDTAEPAAPAAPRTEWTDDLFFNEAMSIYHHLAYTAEYPRALSGTWVPSTDLEGGAARNDRRPDPLLVPFAARFSECCEELTAVCEALGGQRLKQGDVSYQFAPFPQVPLQVIFWDKDEDFPAQVQILADRNSIDYIHRETIGCIVSDLLEQLQLTADLMSGRTWVLRPHHGMCMAYYQGKGYSEDFTEHMTDVLLRMKRKNPGLLLLAQGDIICSHCPFFEESGVCQSQDHVTAYDQGVLEQCKLPEGSVVKYFALRKMIRERILDPGARESICGQCQWTKLCQ